MLIFMKSMLNNEGFLKRNLIFFGIFLLLLGYYLSYNYLYLNLVLRVGKPVEIGSIIGEQHEMQFYFDNFGMTRFDGQETYQIVGWVFPKNLSQNLSNFRKQVILKDDHDLVYYFNTENMTRIDITRHYKDLGKDLDESGFTVNISKYSLPKGKYHVGFRLLSEDSKDNCIYFTKFKIIKTSNSLQFIKP